MSNTNITICMDTELKKQAVREQQLPFIVSKSYNVNTIQAIRDARNDIGLSSEFSSVSELMEDLNSDLF